MARSNLHVGLEIGTSKVAAVIAETRSDGLLRIIGTGEAPSRGVRKGEIVDIGLITLCLTDAVAEAEEAPAEDAEPRSPTAPAMTPAEAPTDETGQRFVVRVSAGDERFAQDAHLAAQGK